MSQRIEVDFTTVLRNLDGEPFSDRLADGSEQLVTLGHLAKTALTANVLGDKGDQTEVFKRCRLAEKLSNGSLDDDETAAAYAKLSLNMAQRKMIADRIFAFVRMPRTIHGAGMPEGMVLFYRANDLLEIQSDVDEEKE
ncbi:MAG TPA: hypothetical protein DCQ64_13690 [Candidatus Rokubacteria bacterium]|nr:hypothetical protein [Candidatus Rokubacteria bacterium]